MSCSRTLALLVLSLLATPGARGVDASQLAERVARIDAYLSEHLDSAPIPGFSAVVVVGNQIVFEKGYGVQVLGQSAPVTHRSPIGIGSQTKSFTAFAIMQQIEAGTVELDAPVTRYLPWFKTADGRGGEITVRMLLHNTSGLPSVDRWLTSSDRSEDAARRSVEQLSSVALVRSPGKSFEYANENWTVLGLILESVTGKRYSRVLQETVLDAMAMTNSTTALEAV